VQCGTTNLVLDLGPGTLPELRRHTDFRTLSAVIISHMHVDHVLDLLALRHALAYNPVPPPRPIPVWLPPGGAGHLARATAPFDASDEPGRFAATVQVAEYDPARALRIADIVVSFAPAQHFIPAWAIRVQESGGRDLGYTGDTGPTPGLATFFRGVRVLVAEATLLDPEPNPAGARESLTAAEAGKLAAAAGAETLILTHMWEEFDFAAYRERAASVFSGRIALASPGLTVSC
jgi:ribonuclease BN (tRNA processing enzyme)